MTIEEESVDFLKNQIETGFSYLLSRFTIKEVEWLKYDDLRPIAFLEDEEGNKSNLICLFPPFIPKTPNK